MSGYFRGSGDEVLFLLMWMLGAISIFAAFYCCWDKAVRKRMRVPSTLVSDTDDPSFTTAPAATRVRPTDSPPEYSRYPPQVRQADYSEEPPPPYSVVVESQQMYLHTQNPLEVDIQQPYFTTPPIGVHQINSAR
ncbi:uncharacterized protein [Periplaneta americana]|uniref:uncharacterized protein isoform X2 n=1 Tax=Periplaneta americana TaxID=6978 RepID=UPI0037E99FED